MKKIFFKICTMFKDTAKPKKIDWILFVIVATFLFISFIYTDLLTTVTHTKNILLSMLNKDFLGVYKNNYNVLVNGINTTVCYELPIYLFFIIWNIPLWIANIFKDYNMTTSFIAILWMKGILIAFLYGCVYAIKKICKKIELKDNLIKWVILIFVSSPLLLSSTFILSQYDIIPLFFILLGVYAYINKDYKRFVLWFAIAIPLKLFALFAFIPLLLLKEKRIVKIMFNTILASSILCISKIISSLMPYYHESTSAFNSEMFGRLLTNSTIKMNLGTASVFI